MEKQLLALGYNYLSNYIKLPSSVLAEFTNGNTELFQMKKRPKKNKSGINLTMETNTNTDLKILPPYYFMIESSDGVISYCGVLDFTSDEGVVMIPNFILNQMGINGSDFVKIKYIGNIPKCDFVVLEPLDKFIFQIPDLDKFLENILSKYCLLYNQFIIEFNYDNSQYRILTKSIRAKTVEELQDETINVVDIINTDIKIDIYNRFYEEEKRKEQEKIEKQKVENVEQEKPFAQGEGKKLGGLNINDVEIIRELRIQKLLEYSKQNKPQISIKKEQPLNIQPTNFLEVKQNKKSKEFDV